MPNAPIASDFPQPVIPPLERGLLALHSLDQFRDPSQLRAHPRLSRPQPPCRRPISDRGPHKKHIPPVSDGGLPLSNRLVVLSTGSDSPVREALLDPERGGLDQPGIRGHSIPGLQAE